MAEQHLIERSTTAGEVAKVLRQRILNGELAEGTYIRQEAVAAELGVSRIPVREALTQLEAEGIVIREKYRGALVPHLSIEEIRELYALRGLLEPFLLDHAFPNIDSATLESVRRLIQKSVESKDIDEWAALNWEIHKGIYVKAAQPITFQILEQVLKRADRYLKLQRNLSAELLRESDEQHLEILRLIEGGKRKEAVAALQQHISWNEADLRNILQRASGDAA